MDYEEETFNKTSNSNGVLEKRSRRSGFWAVFSCFGGTSSSDMSGDEATNWSRGKRLAVVPLETSGGESDQKKERKKMVCHKSFKGKSKGTNAPTKPQPIQEENTVRHLASKLKAQTKPVPVYWMLDPVQMQTQTRVSHPGSPEAVNRPASKKVSEENSKKKEYGTYMGLSVLTFALAMIILGGLTFGVICMCAWFCILYVLRPGTVPEQDGTSEKKSEEVDANSDEYKKMVVLRGFLERDKRKSLIEKISDGA